MRHGGRGELELGGTSSSMFEVDCAGCITLDGVYLNGLHALRSLGIRNSSEWNLIIKLRSNLGDQIAFQLTNENLPDRLGSDGKLAADPGVIETAPDGSVDSTGALADHGGARSALDDFATNTVAAAAIGAFGTEGLHGHQFNQLFNFVNHIDEVSVPAGATVRIVLAFLPDGRVRGNRPLEGTKDDGSAVKDDVTTQSSSANEDEELYDFFEVNGALFFYAFREARPVEPKPFGDDDDVSGDNDLATSDWKVSVDFHSRVCRSYLWTDVGETGITFDDCVLGEPYYKDFYIWNRSEIELYWVLNAVDLSRPDNTVWLKFTDENGQGIEREPIPSFSSKLVRMTFYPKEIGEFKYDLQIENANDSSNIVQANVNANVKSVVREETLLVTPGTLDFGDCYTGTVAKTKLTLRNIGDVPIDISFAAENPAVVFQLKSEDLMEEKRHRQSIILPATDTIGDRLLADRLRELSALESKTVSEFSNPASSYDSRSSSPTNLGRHDSEIMAINGSVEFLDDLSQAQGSIFEGETLNDPPLSFDSRNEGEEYTRIEELVVRPGTERAIEVCYCLEKENESTEYQAGKLTRRNFRLNLSYSPQGLTDKQRKIIQCKARTCTSLIEVTPKEVNFGDTDVGTLKSAPIHIVNHSDLPARVEMKFISKVLNCYRGEILIPPRQSTEVKIDIYPRKVNPEYCKQIAVVNLLNRENNQIVEVKSNHIDKNRVTFHSLFYRILTPTSANFIDFNAVVLNSAAVRTFTVDNISKKKLVLEIQSSMPEELFVFRKGAHHFKEDSLSKFRSQLRERHSVAESTENCAPTTHSTERASVTDTENTRVSVSAPPLPPNQTSETDVSGTEKRNESVSVENLDTLDSSQIPLSDLIMFLEQGLGNIPKSSLEEKYIKGQQFLRRELDTAIADGRLVPVQLAEVEPESHLQVILVMKASGDTRPAIQSKPRKHDTKLVIRMVEFDRFVGHPQFEQLLHGDLTSIPVRELMVRCSLCRSIMELDQRNLAFGSLDKKEAVTKTIVIRNKSEALLLYSIRTPGTIASLDLKIVEGRMGVIRGHGKREVEFRFNPSLAGSFQEKFIIENVLDRENDQVLNVKATIKNPSKFSIRNNELDFGPCLINQLNTKSQRLEIVNDSKQKIFVEVSVNEADLKFGASCLQFIWEVLDDEVTNGFEPKGDLSESEDPSGSGRKRRPTVLSSRETEDQIEALEEKLKIAKRKGREDKVKKIFKKLENLRGPTEIAQPKSEPVADGQYLNLPATADILVDKPVGNGDPSADSSFEGPMQSIPSPNGTSVVALQELKKADNSIVTAIEPGISKSIVVHVRPSEISTEGTNGALTPPASSAAFQLCSGFIYINELKNTDTIKQLGYKTAVFSNVEDLSAAIRAREAEKLAEAAAKAEASRTPSPRQSTIRNSKSPPSEQNPEIIKSVIPPTLTIERPIIDLGGIEIFERKECYFTIENCTNQPLKFSIRSSPASRSIPCSFDEHGLLDAMESRRISMHIVPSEVGFHKLTYLVSNAANDEIASVTFSFSVYYPQTVGRGAGQLPFEMRHICSEKDITVPEGVTVAIKARRVRVKGPRGVIHKVFQHVNFECLKTSPTTYRIKVWQGERKHIACIRTICSRIENMITGVTKGYEYKMRLVYAHFPINVNIVNDGKQVEVRNFVGQKVIMRVEMLDGVSIVHSTAQKDELVLSGIDIDNVSQSAASIQQSCRVRNKDIRKFLDGIYVSEKDHIVKE
ncbi:hypothetical protein HK101_001020 [Irineochytrium annulatum]|nr:hypothetical protein HK101_001020 [Irineochytrium annulatum]